MKRVIGSFIMVVLLYLLQTTIFNNIAIAGVKPNVILIPIVIVGYRYGRVQGMVLGFFTGLFIDLNESDYLGYCALFYLIIGYLVGFSSYTCASWLSWSIGYGVEFSYICYRVFA